MAEKSQSAGTGWTEQQRAGQSTINSALDAARRAPVQGREVPAQARRAGHMGN